MRGRKFVKHIATNGESYFTFVASNGQVLMTSETYSTEQTMMDTLNTLLGKKLPIKLIENKIN